METSFGIEKDSFSKYLQQWESLITDLPVDSTLGETGIFTNDVTNLLKEIFALFEALERSNLSRLEWIAQKDKYQGAYATLSANFQSSANNFAIFTQRSQEIIRDLVSIRDILRTLLPEGAFGQKQQKIISSKMALAETMISNLENKGTSLSKLHEELANQLKAVEVDIENVRKSSTLVDDVASNATLKQAEVLKMATVVEQISEKSASDAATAEELLRMIQEAKKAQQELFDEFNKRRDETVEYLNGANRYGLAKAFQDKRISKVEPAKKAARNFFVAILVLAGAGIYESYAILTGPISITESIAKTLIVGPLVWLAGFYARQYTLAVRVMEDYSFKEASALAFVGYRDEVAKDDVLLGLLRAEAIAAFGANPVRLIMKHDETAAPLDVLRSYLQSLMKNVLPDSISKN